MPARVHSRCPGTMLQVTLTAIPREIRVRGRSLLIASLSLAIASPSNAQSPAHVPIPYTTFVAINPMGIPFNVASVEIESGVANGTTIGGVGSYTAIGDDRYATVDLNVRYYPSEVVLDGLSFGLSLGRTHFTTPVDSARRSKDYGTVGLLADYNWLLGARRRFIVGTGIGLKRVLLSSDARSPFGIDQPTFTARFVLGLAF